MKLPARNKRIERAAQVNLRCVLGRVIALMLRQTPVENRFHTTKTQSNRQPILPRCKTLLSMF
jgi:hypothetical protein